MLAAWLAEVEPFPLRCWLTITHMQAHDGPSKGEAVAGDDVQLPFLRCWCRRKRIHVEMLGTVGFRPIAALRS